MMQIIKNSFICLTSWEGDLMESKSAAEELFELVVNNRILMENFNKHSYQRNFEAYVQSCRAILSKISAETARVTAGNFLELLNADQNTLRGRKRADIKLLDRMQIVSYLFPAIKKTENMISELFCEALCEAWKEKYRGEAIEASTYENILSGFGFSLFGIRLF